ncbi:MAG: phenylalanine--tRNA ligase subunit alpha, partial [Nitrosopumilus sp. BACL13 MAG-120910-bin56]
EIILKIIPSILPGEKTLQQIGSGNLSKDQIDKIDLTELLKRPDFIIENIMTSKKISLTDSAKSMDVSNTSGAIDVEANVPELFVARRHPLKDTIDEIREIFVTLGFSEIFGNMTQSSFWNFDALFTPQDHPARELQDTFFLDGVSAKKIGTVEQIRKVSDSHKKNWRYQWDINEARKMVLRTHTTCVTIKHLAEKKPDEARIFSLGRVFRNEKVSYKHLVEFNQIEGIVVGKDANLRNLMGIQREFYKRIGITKIKFWPTFFPYTEPSLQTMVYNEKLGKWIELFGMGIFRPEVTKPLGITKPVLAWGGGIERIAMLKYGLTDVREFYNNDLGWLRSNTKCQ